MIKKMILGALCLFVGTSLYGMNKNKGKGISSVKEMQEAHTRMRQESLNNGVSAYESSRKVRIDSADYKPIITTNTHPIVDEKK